MLHVIYYTSLLVTGPTFPSILSISQGLSLPPPAESSGLTSPISFFMQGDPLTTQLQNSTCSLPRVILSDSESELFLSSSSSTSS